MAAISAVAFSFTRKADQRLIRRACLQRFLISARLSAVPARVPRNRICRGHRISLSGRDIEIPAGRVRCCPGLLSPTSSLYSGSCGTVWSPETGCCVARARAALCKSSCRRNKGCNTNPSYERSCGHRLFLRLAGICGACCRIMAGSQYLHLMPLTKRERSRSHCCLKCGFLGLINVLGLPVMTDSPLTGAANYFV